MFRFDRNTRTIPFFALSMFAALNRSTLQLNALLPPQDLRNLRNEGPTYSVGLVNPGAVAIAYAVVHECVKG